MLYRMCHRQLRQAKLLAGSLEFLRGSLCAVISRNLLAAVIRPIVSGLPWFFRCR